MNDSKLNARMAMMVLASVLALCGFGAGSIAGVKAFSRYQAVQDAENKAKVKLIEAKNEALVNKAYIDRQAERIIIAQKDAEIERERAHGVADAQDIINSKLTPLGVSNEFVRTLKDIAVDGRNNTVIYIPTDPLTGIPFLKSVG